jgi:rSAM/selenodomain-associated transferase 1
MSRFNSSNEHVIRSESTSERVRVRFALIHVAELTPMHRAHSAEALPACGIAIMAKASVAGRTKTRLCPPLTFEQAAELNTAFLKDVAANILAAGRSADIRGYLAYGPPGGGSEAFFRDTMPEPFALLEAWYANFGDSLFAAIDQMLARGHEGAVVLNADSPTLPTSFLIEAAQALARPGDRAVLGPSSDGGYYLLGLKAPRRRLFEDVAWSTDQVAQQTLARAAEIGLPVHVLPTWYDVDDHASLQRLHADLIDEADGACGLEYKREHRAASTRTLLVNGNFAGVFSSAPIMEGPCIRQQRSLR